MGERSKGSLELKGVRFLNFMNEAINNGANWTAEERRTKVANVFMILTGKGDNALTALENARSAFDMDYVAEVRPKRVRSRKANTEPKIEGNDSLLPDGFSSEA